MSKIIGIDHNTCIQTFCFQTTQSQVIRKILQNLSNHFTRRRCIWLNVKQYRLINRISRLSVMVYHYNRLSLLNKFRAFCITCSIYIYNYKYRIFIYKFFCLVTCNNHVTLVFFCIKSVSYRFN